MSTFSLVSRAACIVMLIATSLVGASPAQAAGSKTADGSQVTSRALQSIQNVVSSTQTQMTNTTNSAVSAVQRLDRNNRPDSAIQQAGAGGTRRIVNLQTRNTAQIERRKTAAVNALTKMNADTALIAQVNDAAAAGAVTIAAAATTSQATINAAVSSAIAPSGG